MGTSTQRLDLRKPTTADVPALLAVSSDPRLWTHLPSGRRTDEEAVAADVQRWLTSWRTTGLGVWTVRLADSGEVIGDGGCGLRHDTFWNLGYRLAFHTHGRGLATELATEAVAQAHRTRSDLPVVAYLLEHNHASAAVALKAGLTLQHRAPDRGNPDAAAIRLVYADRPLTAAQLAATLH